jgi:hypothetical protein
MMTTLARIFAAILIFTFTGCATSREAMEQPDSDVIREVSIAVLRARLTKTPLPPGRELHVFASQHISGGLSEQFREYHVIVHDGAPSVPSPRARWYAFRFGRVTVNSAFVYVRGNEGGRFVELRKRDHEWIIIHDDEPIIT